MSDRTPDQAGVPTPAQRSIIGRTLRYFLENRLVVGLMAAGIVIGGVLVAPFEWDLGDVQRYPVPVDAIPDIGENQQIVFTQWMGRSPQDVEDQISYPLTVSLLGIPGVETIRSYSMFGFSTIYVIFDEEAEFYWSRTRLLEKLNSLPAETLPVGVRPTLGPDATALGQVYWYTLEGRDPDGQPVGGWGQEELRTLQDWYVRYWLLAAEGVAEVASIGGYVKEYQVDVDPDAMRAYGVTLDEVFRAVQAANIDVGAKALEMNRVEYFVRSVGFVKRVEDLQNSVVRVGADNVPVLVKHVAHVAVGPATRRGALDKAGAPVVGGVVVARYGDNPLAVINRVKEKVAETAAALPTRAVVDYTRVSESELAAFARERGLRAYDGRQLDQQAWVNHLRASPRETWPEGVTLSTVTAVPFYDRTGLIYETLATLNDAIAQQILITIVVVVLMIWNLRSSLLVSGLLPLAVLLCFAGMKAFGVQANIVALSGIAIAIGTIVDMGIVIGENILRHLDTDTRPDAVGELTRRRRGREALEVVHRAASEVGGAVLTAVATTVVSFLPVFTMVGAEGKLFRPLAYTKTFALVASIAIALAILPTVAHLLFGGRSPRRWVRRLPPGYVRFGPTAANVLAVAVVGVYLTRYWEPLGAQLGQLPNLVFVAVLVAGVLGLFGLFRRQYPTMLSWCLEHKALFLSAPLVLVVLGATIWLGFERTFGWLPEPVRRLRPVAELTHRFPGLGKEFMPDLDEGSYLWMPTTMAHASIGEALDVLQKQDMAFQQIPEIESVVGKLGRAETPLDPAPISMIETVIAYKPEYRADASGRRQTFRYDEELDDFPRDEAGELIPDPSGRPFRQWRDHIRSPDDIWDEIVRAGRVPGTTSAPRLQPIAARIVMLQSGMRAPMGVKIKGPDLETIEQVGLQLEALLKRVPGVEPSTVIADRIVGKPYLEIVPDRKALARYGIPIRQFQDAVEIAIGGRQISAAVEGRERYPIRVRYQRELRDHPEALERILVAGSGGAQIPIAQLAEIRYVRGPQVIKSEDTFLVGYVVFDKQQGYAEVDVVEAAQAHLKRQLESGRLGLPRGVSYAFAGSYENQQRAARTLALVLPLALVAIFLILYFQFRSVSTTVLIFSGVFVAWSGGFLLIWLYGQPWFLDFGVFGVSMRTLFQIHPINLSVAVWVGFLALFGIATDDGVIQSTYLNQVFAECRPDTRKAIRNAVVEAAQRRVRPCLMTSATTILALLPVLTSTGRGSDVMVPMAIPTVGGMLVALLSIFVVPVLYSLVEEVRLGGR